MSNRCWTTYFDFVQLVSDMSITHMSIAQVSNTRPSSVASKILHMPNTNSLANLKCYASLIKCVIPPTKDPTSPLTPVIMMTYRI